MSDKTLHEQAEELDEAIAKLRAAIWEDRHYLRTYLTGALVGSVAVVIILTLAGRLSP
jgi:hypothetical protein